MSETESQIATEASTAYDHWQKSGDAFVKNGWVLVTLPDPSVVHETRTALTAEVDRILGHSVTRLEDYHRFVESDDDNIRIQQALSDFYWASGFARRIVAAQRAFLSGFIGADLLAQTYPYLRIARPGKPRDNLGFHRDTHHGSSPFEVSMFVPFTDLDESSAFRVLSGSHADPESDYPFEQVSDPIITRGSALHKLGFPYAPKILRPEVALRSEPVPMRVGQALFMSLGLVHGQEVNAGTTTRISSDIRIVNGLAPVSTTRGVRDDYFTSLWESPSSRAARMYTTNNPSHAI
ncbi:hypothetical protein [Azospirillum griseum]|uniref:Phytanoyl-CoA dioxygenase n=1 Tax=Azospirillum griseum TaxID=2496639 RepID=A0A431V9L2_9PROT|nr:hypothetical protein [Azospirillum griseum]RTR12008.1 hypothetical protein EJ903_25740 [Azospirillum griseum]